MRNLILVFILMFLSGCVVKESKAAPYLNEYGKLVVFTDSKENCKVLGDIKSGISVESTLNWQYFHEFDTFARNDLRNQASVFAKNGENIKLRIIDKKIMCREFWKDCMEVYGSYDSIPPSAFVISLDYTAEILKCN